MQTPYSRIYVGRVEGGVPTVYAVGAVSAEPLESPGGAPFAWGAGAGAGADRLAHAILTDASGSEPSEDVCRRFCEQILTRLPTDGFALQRETVNAWLRRVVAV